MPEEALAHTDWLGQLPFTLPQGVGNTKIVVILVPEHHALLYIPNCHDCLPILVAAINAHKNTLSHLLTLTEADPISMPFSNKSGGVLIASVIISEFYGE
ncbi:hypothetical protein Acr_12g0010560 [Actinidia rufa]|uniref:Uncharacterized protein n=1 Tax=Actinidia rufa TaxID=165716 RepID=A0A7J0FIJ6_9ERIC|nr:hypothetical protein Acr_12g0010560 [Actinidia rufa]